MIIEVLVTALKGEASLTALGDPALADRIYPNSAPDAPTYPIVVISKVYEGGESTFDGEAGIARARVQIDVEGIGYAAVVAIKREIRRLMLKRPPLGDPCVVDSVHCINDMDSPAAGPIGATERAGPKKIRRRVLEFTVWHRAL